MKKFKQLLTAIQTFMDTEVELTEQAVHQVQIRPRIPYFLGGLVMGSWTALTIDLLIKHNNILLPSIFLVLFCLGFGWAKWKGEI